MRPADTKQLSSAQRELRQNADETRQALERQQKSLKRLGEQQARMNAVRDQYSRRLEVGSYCRGRGNDYCRRVWRWARR
jgi:phage-related tail protein